MRKRLLLTLAALLVLPACEQQASGPQPEYSPEDVGTVDHALCLLGFTAVPVAEVATGHHLIEATINGTTGMFVLDTGANMTVIDSSHLQRFGLENAPGGLGSAISVGSGGQAKRIGIESFSIAGVPIRQGRIVASDLGQLLTVLGRAGGTTVDGIIGQDVLNEHRAIIDVARPMLYLISPDREPAPVPAERCSARQAADSAAD